METINYQGLQLKDAKLLCEALLKEFGLYWTRGGFCVTGNTVTASIKKNYRKSKQYITPRFDVQVTSSYWSKTSLQLPLSEFEYYQVASLQDEDHELVLN